MKEIVTKYLDKQYRFTLSTYVSYNLYDKIEKKDVGLKDALRILPTIFDIDQEEISDIFDEWADKKAIEINNRIIDIRYKIYECTGLELELTTSDLNKFMEAYDMGTQEVALNEFISQPQPPIE